MKKLLVLFGSKSDEYVYGPLTEKLGEKFDVQMEVISAHRDPDLLAETLGKDDFDAIVAGAGLAAHLPGVVASKTSKPVFGVPVEACFGGLDALLSIQMMPFGVPVLACGGSNWDIIPDFISHTVSMKTSLSKLNVVVNTADSSYEYVKKELDRTVQFAKDENIEISVSEVANDECLNIWMVTRENELEPHAKGIFVPILEPTDKDSPASALKVFDWTNKGGLWVGVNNTRNAIKFFQKFS